MCNDKTLMPRVPEQHMQIQHFLIQSTGVGISDCLIATLSTPWIQTLNERHQKLSSELATMDQVLSVKNMGELLDAQND